MLSPFLSLPLSFLFFLCNPAALRQSFYPLYILFFRTSSQPSRYCIPHGINASIIRPIKSIKVMNFRYNSMGLQGCIFGILRVSYSEFLRMSLTLDQAITFQSFDWKSVDVRVVPVLSEPLTIVDCQLVRAEKKREKRKRKVDLTSRLDDSSNAGMLCSRWYYIELKK